MTHYSFAPIDVGFDLREHEMLVCLAPDATSITTPEGKLVEGDLATLRAALEGSGLRVSRGAKGEP